MMQGKQMRAVPIGLEVQPLFFFFALLRFSFFIIIINIIMLIFLRLLDATRCFSIAQYN
jgi:hypothetical protein